MWCKIREEVTLVCVGAKFDTTVWALVFDFHAAWYAERDETTAKWAPATSLLSAAEGDKKKFITTCLK